MAPNLKSIVSRNIRDHTTRTVIKKVLEEKDGNSLAQSPETAAMVRDWESLSQKRGKQSLENHDRVIQEKKPDVDGMTDEELSRISVHISSVEEESGEHSDEKTKEEETAKFDEYKHHQFVRRWGLLQDSDGRDEEWFILDPPVLEETDPQYLCDMCRHIDFKVLLSQRGLPGNQLPGQSRISVYGIPKVMDDRSPCAFCRLIRKRAIHDGILTDVHPDNWPGMQLSISTLDDGPGFPLRLEVEFSDLDRSKVSRLVIHPIEQEESQSKPLQGLVVRKDSADISRLRGWLHTCKESHKASEADSTGYLKPLMDTLRVIDTTDNCVKEVDTPCDYICLSYVWGTGSQTQYTTKTKDQLSKPGGLEDAELPQTILDAIKVTKELGIRYIWIDALCITQDDKEDKARIISNMGTIYANAMLSIMASSNVDPTDGLPGVGVPRSQEQSIEKLQGTTLAVAFQDARQRHSDIEDRLWNTRAWTFQERVLSQRSVYFTDSQMCFVCPHLACFEDTVPVLDPNSYTITPFNDQLQLTSRIHDLWVRIWSDPTQATYINKAFATEDDMTIFIGEDPATGEASEDGAPLYKSKAIPSSDTVDAPLIKGHTLWEAYAHAVDAYTKRNMTWQSDAVNAFIGIADLIRRGTNTKFWHAMPEFALTRSLLWYPKEPLSRRRSPDGKILFPSWSWAAWQGHVTYRGRGFHNAVCYAPTSMITWLKSATVEEFMETFVQVERSQEEIEERRRQAESSRLLLHKTDVWSLLHVDCYEHGWVVERNEDRNQHLFVHDAYPGMKFEYPINLPDQPIVELPFEDTLYFRAKAVSVRLCDKPSESYLASPIQDNFVQIGVNDEDRSANNRRPWQRILYHQGYRAGSLSLNVPLDYLNIPSTTEEAQISPPLLHRTSPIGWEMYWDGDPMRMQYEILQEEWLQRSRLPEGPDESVKPNDEKVNETGDPRWDPGRFGSTSVLDVCNVLLLREARDGVSERVGVGKISYCAFFAAKPEPDVFYLK
ncbi:heterokaryon incompatibility protein-domain-containing protein [Fusarium redolens]|uniref:Heterokaryon incompatibility protein-domain-containing protein n=1 Tax=Fusarium redolens TaxID=48865 RepID=A0A9P9H149_FUSRE|nr:heterokaryon incompatibility protein-domain-containing protein [Fusarium redolens]KAH7248567.1 heterokaryon incompatibility protein-domain-containing protein [Fusarium redolens]